MERLPKRLRADTPEWLELWAVARYDLRLSEDDFWNMSIDEFQALLRHHNLELERQDYHAALICWTLANIFRSDKSRSYKVSDFMPGKPKQKRKQSTEEMVEILKGFTAFYRK